MGLQCESEDAERGKPSQSVNPKKQNRRGWGKKLDRKNFKRKINKQNFSIFGANSNGIKGKLESLLSNINHFKPSCINIQESKLRFCGTIKLQGYEIFENIREGLCGGLLTAVDKDICPVLISSGDEKFEAIIVQVKIGSSDLRIFNCYGPQELGQAQRSAAEQGEKINAFWQELEQEVIKAYDDGCLILIEMDANAKVGSKVIKNDPNAMSENGRLLLDLVDRQNLRILNSSSKCEGVITRQRTTVDRVEQSVIDYLITCEELFSYLQSMLIDENRKHVLTKFASVKGELKR